jgi:uncharacterized protein (TIGR04255 family)
MATPRQLTRPPIVEALIDFACIVDQPQEAFEAFGQQFESSFPTRTVRKGFRGELRIEEGKVVPPTMEDTGFDGLMLSNRADDLRVQFRTRGFTLNNVKRYIGGDGLVVAALQHWTAFAQHFGVKTVSRIAFRYINQLELPFRPGDDFQRFLTAAVEVPAGAPQNVSEFLSRAVTHDAARDAVAIITQRLEADRTRPMLIDVDVFRQGEFAADEQTLRGILDTLRALKNEVFFSLLQEEAVELFV